MRTNVVIDDELMSEYMAASHAKTMREAIHMALRESLRLRRQERVMELWGIGWDGDLEAMRTDSLSYDDD